MSPNDNAELYWPVRACTLLHECQKTSVMLYHVNLTYWAETWTWTKKDLCRYDEL